MTSIKHFISYIKNYIGSQSSQLGIAASVIMYLSYGVAQNKFGNIYLIATTCFVGIFIPYYSKLSNRMEEHANLKTAKVTFGRIARFIPQLIFNVAVFCAFSYGHVIPDYSIDKIGGFLSVAVLTTCASQGMQYIGVALANREIGNKNKNVIIALITNIVITAIATMGIDVVQKLFVIIGIAFGFIFFVVGILSDIRSALHPKGGIGVFFGTFNPMHNSHIDIIKAAIKERNLEKVYIHSTVIPKLHRDALDKNEIAISHYEAGMRIYKKTNKADVHVNYFPTGNKFYEYATRLLLMKIAIADAGLSSEVTVLSMPDIYERKSFYGIISAIKKIHPGKHLHGIHGSDVGGMWVRSIYDESGWIYPYSVMRRDKVSATAIRNGASGMTCKTIEKVIDNLRKNITSFEIDNVKFSSVNEELNYERI